jgi:hypothetical protein
MHLHVEIPFLHVTLSFLFPAEIAKSMKMQIYGSRMTPLSCNAKRFFSFLVDFLSISPSGWWGGLGDVLYGTSKLKKTTFFLFHRHLLQAKLSERKGRQPL